MPVDREELSLALARIRATDEGAVLFAFLQHTLNETISNGADDGALRAHNAVRNFARDLMVLSQVQPNADRTDPDARPQPSADPGTGSRGPVAFGRARGVTRRVGADPGGSS